MADKSFVHLHVHAEGSILDGLAKVKDLVSITEEMGQPGVAITDHGNMTATYDLYEAAKGSKVKPIFGMEAYMAPKVSRLHKEPVKWGDVGGEDDVSGAGAYCHMTMLAQTDEGLHNLMKISSEAFLTGFYRKPRCLMPEQEIMTLEGMKQIKNVQLGDLVLTHKGRYKPVTKLMVNEHDDIVYGIVLNNRYQRITWMTGEHPVLIRNMQGELSWTKAEDIKAGRKYPSAESINKWNSYVCLPKIKLDGKRKETIVVSDYVNWKPLSHNKWVKTSQRSNSGPTNHYKDFPSEINLDSDFGYLLGLYLSEGHIDRGQAVHFSLHQDEVDIIDKISPTIHRLTGKIPRVRTRPDRPGYKGIDVIINSSILAELLSSLCGNGAKNKSMPHFTLESNKGFIASIWQGVLDGDGSKTRSDVISLVQTSEQLYWQMRTVGAKLYGDFSNTFKMSPKKVQHAQSYGAYFTNKENPAKYRHTLSDNDFVYKPIKDIETKHYKGLVYNIEVEEDHSYVSDFAMHNCDTDLLEQYGKGIIATTGCVSGEVSTLIRMGKYKDAVESAAKFRDLFDKGNFYVEIMDHGLDIERRGLKDLLRLAKELKLPIVATSDVHYSRKNDAQVHEALLAIGTGSTLDDPTRFKFDSQEFYIKTAQEMRAQWDSEVPEACDNTLLICESITATFHEGKNLLPRFDVPEGETEASWLEKETQRGLERRYPNGVEEDRLDRAKYELGIINKMGFASYFLVTADFIQWSKSNNMRVGPGRGSAAGSLVSYALGITELDPIRHGLLFERFLNPERVSMPDIDTDFDIRYRENVVKYISDKYGHDKVANISTRMSIKAKSGVKDAARVLSGSYGLGDKLNKVYPKPIVGRDLSLEDLYDPANERYDEGAEFRNLVASDSEALKIVELARGLEGTVRGHGMHAAGIIMSGEPLWDTVPLMKKDNNEDTPVMTQFEYHADEALGLLKMDFLGLSNLTTISEALRMIKKNKDIDVDLEYIGEMINDTKTFRLLARGDTLGVFQLDSTPMRSLLRLINVDDFNSLAACLSLFRPGPMGANAHTEFADRKNGRKRVTPIHPELSESLKDILAETFGVICYQEQVMSIAQKVAGYTLGQADMLRRAMGKKSKETLDKEFVGFEAGMKKNGYSQECIDKLWAVLVPFADYAFNKSHAAAYGMVSYWTAYLKANYPVEYMAALLSTNADDKDKSAIYLAECRRMGIKVLNPDINLSESLYSAVGDDIRVGLSAIKGVGEKSVEAWIASRDERGPAKSFSDFLENGDPAICKKNVVAALIKAGAFDSFGKTRASLDAVHVEAVERAAAMKKGKGKMKKGQEQDSLFGPDDSAMFSVMIPEVAEWDRQLLLSYEKDMLGLYVSGHPLADLTDAILDWQDVSIADLKEGARAGATVKIAGLVTSFERKVTKKGDAWALITLEDLDANITVYCFPRTYNAAIDILKSDAIVIISGKSEARDDGSVAFMASSVTAPNLSKVERSDPQLWMDRQIVAHDELSDGTPVAKPKGDPEDNRPVNIKVLESDLTPDNVERLKVALMDHPGYRPVTIFVSDEDGNAVGTMPLEYKVYGSADLGAAIRYLFGGSAV